MQADKVNKLRRLDYKWATIINYSGYQIERIYETVDKAIDLLLDIAAMRLRGEDTERQWPKYTRLCQPVFKEFPQLATFYPFAETPDGIKETVLPIFIGVVSINTGYTGDQNKVEDLKRRIRLTADDFEIPTLKGLEKIVEIVRNHQPGAPCLETLEGTIKSVKSIINKNQKAPDKALEELRTKAEGYVFEHLENETWFRDWRAYLRDLRLYRKAASGQYTQAELTNESQFNLTMSHYVIEQCKKFWDQFAVDNFLPQKVVFKAIQERNVEGLFNMIAVIKFKGKMWEPDYIQNWVKKIMGVCDKFKTDGPAWALRDLQKLDSRWGDIKLPPEQVWTLYDIVDEAIDCLLDIAGQRYINSHNLGRVLAPYQDYSRLWKKMSTQFPEQLDYFPFIAECGDAVCSAQQKSFTKMMTLILPFFDEYIRVNAEYQTHVACKKIENMEGVYAVVRALKDRIRTTDTFEVLNFNGFLEKLKKGKKLSETNLHKEFIVLTYEEAVKNLKPLNKELKWRRGDPEEDSDEQNNKLAGEFGNL